MENRVLLEKYRVSLDVAGMPIELRRNASGVTCKAEEIESGREVVLDFVTPRNLTPELREKIEVEANGAKQLNHVNIPVLYNFGFDNRDVIYASEYFDGETAESWVTKHGPMPVRVVLRIALQVVSALAAATFQLVMHRAIHPGNILIVSGQTSDGEWPLIKVLNFGRLQPRPRKFGYGTVRDKTAPFASPEQLMNGTVDFRSEIYSLGCTLWSLLTGVSPFNAPGEPLEASQMAPAMKRFRGVPRKVRRLITQMAATDPDDRPLDPVMMTERLQRCLASVERREAIASKLGIPLTWQRRRVARPTSPLAARPVAMAAIVLALAALFGFILTKGSPANSLWKKFAAREPIGVPVGVPEASVAAAKTPPPAIMPPPASSTPLSDVAPATTPVLAAVSPPPNPPPNEQSATNFPTTPMPTASPESTIIATNTAPVPVQAPSPQTSDVKVPRAELIEPAPLKSSTQHVEQDRPPRAELVEPPPPTEGPEEAAAENSTKATGHKFPVVNSEGVPRAELVEPPPAPSSKKTRRKRVQSSSLTESELAVIRRASRRTQPARVTVEGDGALVRTPDGVFHARRIGTTPDGRWMLALPSREIMVVPPPPDYIPR